MIVWDYINTQMIIWNYINTHFDWLTALAMAIAPIILYSVILRMFR